MAVATYNKTETVYVQGKLSWAKRLFYPDDRYQKYSVQIHPNSESLEKIRDLQTKGLKNILKKDDDGYYTQFSRPTVRKYGSVVKTFEAPIVVDKDGQPIGDVIGNGSDATLKLEVYEHGTPGGGKAVAARLVSVRVDNLVAFDPKRDFTEKEQELRAGLAEQPEQLF
jgi:hypothetical protein